MNWKQKIWIGLCSLVMALLILFPPWVQVLRNDAQERHVVFLGRAPRWAPPPPTRNLDTAIEDDVKPDVGEGITNMLSAMVLFGLVGWFIRTRTP